jgi:hypothetical protein
VDNCTFRRIRRFGTAFTTTGGSGIGAVEDFFNGHGGFLVLHEWGSSRLAETTLPRLPIRYATKSIDKLIRSSKVPDTCTDRLDALLHHFPVRARLFHSGSLCGVTRFDTPESGGQLHLVQHGELTVEHPGQAALHIGEPSLLFYPRPLARRFISDPQAGATLACAQLQFDGGATTRWPAPAGCGLRAAEGHSRHPSHSGPAVCRGLQPLLWPPGLLDRLFEAVFIQLLRYLMETGAIRGGMLAGMSHPKLRRALVAMHEQPQQDWTLDALAALCGMSRSVFANSFRNTLGCTPGVYLQGWRISLAQQMLRKGQH